MQIAVDSVFKGSAPSQARFLNGSSLSVQNDQYHWGFTSCAIFGADPTGHYVIAGLYAQEDGTLRSHSLLFFSGDEPEGERYHYALERLSPLGPATLPTSGGPPPAVYSSTEMPWLAIALGAGTLVAASAFLLRRRLTRR